MSRLLWSAVAFVIAVIYGIRHFIRKRNESKDLPQPPRSFVWGNFEVAIECIKLFPPSIHQQSWATYIRKKYNLGDIFYLDWWPLGPRLCFIADPDLISQYITTGQSLPKAPLETDYLNTFLGDHNMVSLEGAHWKRQRAMFNPGFSASHLMTLVPYIVDASMVFYDVIREKAETQALFELEEYATRLTIDIIGKVVLDSDFDSQKAVHPIVETFRTRVGLMPNANKIYPWDDFSPLRPYRRWLNGRKLDSLIGLELDNKIKARANSREMRPKSFKDRERSVVHLALDGYEKEMANKGRNVNGNLEASVRRDIIDSMKTFIFAGHDTTASTISYTFYMLHFHPRVFRKLVQELDTVFGTSDANRVADKIKNEPYIINQLEYATAIIKETLRLHPPASTMRYVAPASDPTQALYITDRSGRQLPINGWTVWPVVHMVSRNEEYFPKPAHFIPERFIPSQTPFPDSKLFSAAGKDAWRPFEKGPRSCIGQELAMIESKVTLALCVRDFDFVAEYDGEKCESWTPIDTVDEFKDGRPGRERMTAEGHRGYQILKGAAKPRDGLPGRMSLRPPLSTGKMD